VLNNPQLNIFMKTTQGYIESQAKVLCNEFLEIETFFPDFFCQIDFQNKISATKSKILQDLRSRDYALHPDIHISDYLQDYKLAYDNLFNYTDMIKQAKYRQGEQNLKSLRRRIITQTATSSHPEYDYDNPLGLILPADNESIFEFGEESRRSKPFWKINQLTVVGELQTDHSVSDLINDVILLDNDKFAVSCSNDKSIRITNLKEGREVLAIPCAH
jgi:WD40 repeat protein